MEDFRLAEASCESDVFGVTDVLVREDKDQMLHPDVMDELKGFRVEWRAHVDAAHFGAEGRVQRADLQAIRNDSG